MPTASLTTVQGVCYAIFAYDVGLAIDLEACPRLLATLTPRTSLRPTPRTPQYFAYRPSPLHLTQEVPAIPLGSYTSTSVDIVLYDFGAISLTYHIPLHGALRQLIALSAVLHDNAPLLHDSRQRVADLLRTLRPAIQRPSIADFVEDYAIFHLTTLTPPCAPEELLTSAAQEVAQMLRVDDQTLSGQEVQDALSHRLAYGLHDVAILDWHAALLCDQDATDVRAVLEFANVELLEMRYLDDQLDHALDQAYNALSPRTGRWGQASRTARANLRQMAQMQVESAMLFEGVNNALKLVGDQYLARLYRLASQRFHLEEWDASIMRKLHTLESIYQKAVDRATEHRMEVLEWIIIVLIAVSIVLPMFSGLPWH